MIIDNLPQIGNSILTQVSEPVIHIDQEVLDIIENLTDTMRACELVGMAAPQIGVTKRILVTEIRETKNRKNLDVNELCVYINPKITRFSEKKVTLYEACGSVFHTQLFAPVERPEFIEIQAYDLNMQLFTLKVDGFLARVIQHEYDHLEGILFTEKISDLSKIMDAEAWNKKNAL